MVFPYALMHGVIHLPDGIEASLHLTGPCIYQEVSMKGFKQQGDSNKESVASSNSNKRMLPAHPCELPAGDPGHVCVLMGREVGSIA